MTMMMFPFRPTATAALWCGLLAQSAGVLAQDWPQWRGALRDGVASFEVSAWPEALEPSWNIEVGFGYATPLLSGDRLYLYTRQGDDEVVTAHSAATGELFWRSPYPAPFEVMSAARFHGPGPKSTPVLADGRLFTLGMTGTVTAFNASDGRQLWQQLGGEPQPLYHTAMSPIVDGEFVIVHIGGHNDGALTAFDVTSGDVRWSWDGDGPAYGSPMIFELDGVRQVVTFTQENFIGVSLETGELLWRRPFTTQSTTTSQTPILHENTVIEAGRGNGITAVRVTRNGDRWATENVWHTDEVSLHMTNGVVVDGVLYGLSHLNSGQYFGLDLDTGDVLWKSEPRQAENAGMVSAGDVVVSLQDDGELVVLRASKRSFDVVKRYEVADTPTWTQPTLSGNRIYVKDVTTLSLYRIE